MQLTINLRRRLDPPFPVCSLPFGKLALGSAGDAEQESVDWNAICGALRPNRFVLEGHGVTGFVTGYEVDVIHHTARIHPASVFSARSSAHRVSVVWDTATWMWPLACSGAGLLFFSARLEWHFVPAGVCWPSHTERGRPFSDFGCSFNVADQVIF
jgi:hypothetical protein